VPRIRLSSLGPEFLNDEFFEAVEDKRIMPYFHLSVQSWSDKVLQRMRRQYDSKLVDKVFSKFKDLEKTR